MELEGEVVENHHNRRWFSGWLKWCPTSDELLQAAEARILKSLKVRYEERYVKTSQQDKIWTVLFNPQGEKTPVLMIHGFGGGLGMWVLNIEELSNNRPVYTFDLLGFGRSGRPNFDEDPEIVQETFVASIEDTRKELGLNEKFILLGHSFGGYLAYAYTIKHPENVKSLILADPWGFQEKPPDWEKNVSIPAWIKFMATVLEPFNPFAGLRFAGPLGPSVLRRLRPDLQQTYSSLFPDDTILNYIYHCNAQTPSGEIGFKKLVLPYGWARFPMVHRIKDLNTQVKVAMLLGGDSWIQNRITSEKLKAERPDNFEVHIIRDAGHHVFADEPLQFNGLVKHLFNSVDEDLSSES